jgi:hypothetical protein
MIRRARMKSADPFLARMDVRFDRMEARFDEIDAKLDALAVLVAKYLALGERLSGHERRIEKLEPCTRT